MSNAVSALQGATSDGIAKVTEVGLRGMIILRGDLTSAKLKKAAKAATGVAFPDVRECHCDGDKGLAWMSPDELLVMVPYADVVDATARIAKALAADHALAVNVSDARAVFSIEGAGAREVLAKLAPVDLSRKAFTKGMFRRTRLAQAPVAFWARDEDAFDLMCFRSEAKYVFDLLTISAKAGSQVGFL
ncbi:sarcosine oxidase subunit gamma [Litoreibacter arenae]|uniref:Sarcosine oxidase gamma subunit n=1 Tax=Litoreibacter arenae DSM 19593 TaxID=1123360 RepID=S9QHG8_9RHOB|nr:sarcosine oxidase subunit gamma family protein [Litoreibacter arenae]EPX79282.1 Sarcosine oxidase gamma subunit [Litoreibacter arenae DSM 19593]